MLALHGNLCRVSDVVWEADGMYRFNPPGTISPSRLLRFSPEREAFRRNISHNYVYKYLFSHSPKLRNMQYNQITSEAHNLEQFNPNSLHESPEKSLNFMQAVAPGLFFLSSSISHASKNGTLIVKAIMLRMIGVAITPPSFGMMILVVGFTV